MSPDRQAKLLRMVQERVFLPLGAASERPFAARLVCATHADQAAGGARGQAALVAAMDAAARTGSIG